MPYPSLYRAKAVNIRSGAVEVFVPQVFGETAITVTDSLGGLPTDPSFGWIFFQAGNPEFPVWASGVFGDSGASTGGGGSGPPGGGIGDGGGGIGGGGGGGGGGLNAYNEVFIGAVQPADSFELWYDTLAPGPGGAGGGVRRSYVHHQDAPSNNWTIDHNLGFFPNVTVTDSVGTNVEGDVTHVNDGIMTIRFSGAFSGTAYLS